MILDPFSSRAFNHSVHLNDIKGWSVLVKSRPLYRRAVQVLCAELAISYVLTTLKHCPKGLKSVSVSLSIEVYPGN